LTANPKPEPNYYYYSHHYYYYHIHACAFTARQCRAHPQVVYMSLRPKE